MLAITRKNEIKDIVLEKKSVTVTELSKQFSVTEETIRRDLKSLEDEGFLLRTYGGAFIQDGVQNEVEMTIRETAYVESKKIIACKCLELVHNGDSIFLDSSTTAMFVCNEIKDMRLTVLTNSLKITNLLSDCANINLITIGGIYTPQYMSFLGKSTLQAMGGFFVDKAFLSCRSLSMEHGITDSNEQLAELRQKVLERANQTFLIADYSKFNKTSFIKICDFDEIQCIITDKKQKQEWHEFLDSKSVLLYECE